MTKLLRAHPEQGALSELLCKLLWSEPVASVPMPGDEAHSWQAQYLLDDFILYPCPSPLLIQVLGVHGGASRCTGSSEQTGRGCMVELPKDTEELCHLHPPAQRGTGVPSCPIFLPWNLPVTTSFFPSIHRTLAMKIPAGRAHILLYLLEQL